MAADSNWTTICPHCGAASEDDAICRACGKLLDDSQPVRPFSFSDWIGNIADSWRPVPDSKDLFPSIEEEPEFCFSWRSYPGNIYHLDEK